MLQAEATEYLLELRTAKEERQGLEAALAKAQEQAQEASGTVEAERQELEAALADARERAEAALGKLKAERESAATLEKARAAAVQVRFGMQAVCGEHPFVILSACFELLPKDSSFGRAELAVHAHREKRLLAPSSGVLTIGAQALF